jgi:hypothetical protein
MLDEVRTIGAALLRALEATRDPARRASEEERAEIVEALDRAFAHLLDRARRREPVDAVELARIQGAFHRDLEAVPGDAREAWKEFWLHPKDNIIAAMRGKPGRGEPVVGFLIERRLGDRLRDLELEVARAKHPGPCDCAVLIELRESNRRPSSPSLRKVGPAKDEYYIGDCLVCDACGREWNELSRDDDLGGLFWEPVKP